MSLTVLLHGKKSVLRAEFSPPIQLKDSSEIALLSLVTWNSIPNVDSSNCNFYYNDGKTDHVIKLPTGSYEIDSIQDYLRDYMKLTHSKNPLTDDEKLILGNHPIILIGNRQTLKSEIVCRYTVDFEQPNNIAKILGFDAKTIQPFVRTESKFPVNILNVQVIKLHCNLSEGSFDNNSPVHTLHSFYPDVPPGYKIVEIPKSLIYYALNTRLISEIEIKITDQNQNLLNFRGESIFVRLHIRKCP